MSYISEQLEYRNIPEVLKFKDGSKLTNKCDWEKRRAEMIEIIAENMFGSIPPAYPIETEETFFTDKRLGGKMVYTKYQMNVKTPNGTASFPFYQFMPKGKTNVPTFVHIAFPPSAPWSYCPVESILDRGYGVVLAYYTDITSDDGDFTTGIAPCFPREEYNVGKITLWAWAMQRIMDHVQTLDMVDKNKIIMIGHSRLGKTSLWTAANDTRFSYVCSNNAGCSGDAISRKKEGESVERIYTRFPYWFVPKYAEYGNNEDNMPFDQNFLLASIAPRKMCVGAAILDEWADPKSEYIACVTASPAYEFLGMDGFVCDDKCPEPGDSWQKGNISYHLRDYGHCLSLYDWNKYMDFIDTH